MFEGWFRANQIDWLTVWLVSLVRIVIPRLVPRAEAVRHWVFYQFHKKKTPRWVHFFYALLANSCLNFIFDLFLICGSSDSIIPPFVLIIIVTSLGVCDYRRRMDWWMDLSTTCTHNSELQVITALSLISALYKSSQHPLSLFQPCMS
jgi:hypothetical protein